jgi:hypothetical protein
MCERFIANDQQIETLDVERRVKNGESFDVAGWRHIYICPKSKLTIEEMETIINRSELRIGDRPKFVIIDYIGLMEGGGGKRYEKLSNIAEGLKVLARSTNTVVIVASQVRRDKERIEIDMHDGKDSSAIECSAQLILGAGRPTADTMTIKILKNTKRAGQPLIECNFDGHRQTITEVRTNAPERKLFGGADEN